MIIGTVYSNGQTLIFKELVSSDLVNNMTINELCNYIADKVSYDAINTKVLKIAIIDTERKNIFHFSIENVYFSLKLGEEQMLKKLKCLKN